MSKVVVFTGAGISAESGIATFRDSDGLWENYHIEQVATPNGWHQDKETVLRFYAERWDEIRKSEPNAGHKAIARLQEKHEVINITQNIDDLLERAGCANVWHIHGSINRRKCERHKNITGYDDGCTYSIEHSEPVKPGDLCPKCNSHLRPDVVWFYEYVDINHAYIFELMSTANVFIVIGTSGQVHPAAGFIDQFAHVERKFFIDPKPIPRVGLLGYEVICGTAAEQLPILVADLMKEDFFGKIFLI